MAKFVFYLFKLLVRILLSNYQQAWKSAKRFLFETRQKKCSATIGHQEVFVLILHSFHNIMLEYFHQLLFRRYCFGIGTSTTEVIVCEKERNKNWYFVLTVTVFSVSSCQHHRSPVIYFLEFTCANSSGLTLHPVVRLKTCTNKYNVNVTGDLNNYFNYYRK